jgi:multidrug resistance protein
MPRDWTPRQKWLNVILISFQAAFTPITSTMLASGSPEIAADFKLTDTFTPRLPVALYVLALGIGPLFLGPLSEMYGRRIVYIVNFTLFALFNLACGFAPNIAALATFRFFSGLAGSASTTLSGATVGDMFVPAERARAQAIYGAAPLLGPVIGGILGGYIVHLTGTWRWTMWIMAICPAVSVITCIFFLRETYAPYLMRKHGITDSYSVAQPKLRFANTLLRPLRFLVMSPTCTIMAIYVGL